MRLAFFLDNRGIASRGSLTDPRMGNPGIGGTEFAVLALVAQLANEGNVEPLLLLTAPQVIEGVPASCIAVVPSLGEALAVAVHGAALAFVFRPGFAEDSDWFALENSQIPLVAWLHNLGVPNQARYEALSRLWCWVMVSGAQLDYFRHSRLSGKAVVISNPVAVPEVCHQKRTLEQASRAKDLAYVGAITPFKAFDRLARQWSSIASACPESRLRVFGSATLYGGDRAADLTSYEEYCLNLLERGGHAERVQFEGRCGLERFAAFDSVAVGVVNPSGWDETFCLSAAEFNACGIPVVAPRRHALVQTVLDKKTGLLVNSDRQLALACIALLREPERAFVMGQEGQSFVLTHFSVSSVANAWRDLLDELLSDRSPVCPPSSTAWNHEQRFLRELWGKALFLNLVPSWPNLKSTIKASNQPIVPRSVGWLAAAVAFLIWFGFVFGKYGGNPTGLARIGDQLPLSPLLSDQTLVRLEGRRGNDGQQFLSLALDPFQLNPGTSRALDNPVYRGKRLLYPLLAWSAGLGKPALIVWTQSLINISCIGCAAAIVARWAQLHQRSPKWGFAVLALPGYWVSLSLSTADMLSTTLLLGAALTASNGPLLPHWLNIVGATLTRETGILAWAASCLMSLRERRWHRLLPLVFAPVPLMVWSAYLGSRFSSVTDGYLAKLHFGPPLVGIVKKLVQLLQSRTYIEYPQNLLEGFFDSGCLFFFILTLVLLAAGVRMGWGGRWLRYSCAFYLLPALCVSTQILSRFPDYTRVFVDLSSLTLLVLVSSRTRLSTPWLFLSILISVGYILGYAVYP